MDRPHPLHVVTFALVLLATIFSFVAMRVAFEARDHAAFVAARSSDGTAVEVLQLQEALVRAGVIVDPAVAIDDYEQLDGPWARCLTADEAEAMGVPVDATPASPCETVAVEEVGCSPAPDVAGDEVAEACLVQYRLDGRVYGVSDMSHPADVEAEATDWLLASGTSEVDRVAPAPGGATFLHLIGQGWMVAHPAP